MSTQKTESNGEIWEEWALTYGRNGPSERKNTSVALSVRLLLVAVAEAEVWVCEHDVFLRLQLGHRRLQRRRVDAVEDRGAARLELCDDGGGALVGAE